MKNKATLTSVRISVAIDSGKLKTSEPFDKLGDHTDYLDGKIIVHKDVTKILEYHALVDEVKSLKREVEDLYEELAGE